MAEMAGSRKGNSHTKIIFKKVTNVESKGQCFKGDKVTGTYKL